MEEFAAEAERVPKAKERKRLISFAKESSSLTPHLLKMGAEAENNTNSSLLSCHFDENDEDGELGDDKSVEFFINLMSCAQG